MTHAPLEKLVAALLALDQPGTMAAIDAILEAGGAAGAERAVHALAGALEVVGQRFQQEEWFLGELVYAGEIAKQATERLTPRLSAGADRSAGRLLVVGTVAGDLHDLGKDIFLTYARSAGFELIDLGTDVPAERFAEAAAEHRPLAIGVSCLLTVCAGGIPKVIETLAERGLRDRLRVIVGGAALTAEFAAEVGADAFAPDAVTGTRLIQEWSQDQG